MKKGKLWSLREEIVINSIYLSDYENSLDISTNDLCSFFDAYVEYLGELMEENGVDVENRFFDELGKYDNKDNLFEFYSYNCSEYFTELLNAC